MVLSTSPPIEGFPGTFLTELDRKLLRNCTEPVLVGLDG